MAKPRVQVRVENFGPIVEGTVTFKPLTFLIGPNNTGKTYVATLLYALSRALRGGLIYPVVGPTPEGGRMLARLLLQQSSAGAGELTLSGLPSGLQIHLRAGLTHQQHEASARIEDWLLRYFGILELEDLTPRLTGTRSTLRITAGAAADSDPLVSIAADARDVSVKVDESRPATIRVPNDSQPGEIVNEPDLVFATISMYSWHTQTAESGFAHPHAYYLPAARSGILASWPMLASLAVGTVSRVIGRQPIDIPPLPGVVGDFLQLVIERLLPRVGVNGHSQARAAMQPVLDVLEQKLLGGRVVMDEVRPGAGELTYESGDLRLPVRRASSMIAELAPVDLWVRELLEPGDLLIIDEPESHLHPENQRLIARTLVRLVNAGVDVVAPTHSSTILHQVSNLLLASIADEATRDRLGFTDADRISPDNVGVYLFEQRNDGTYITEVPIDPEFGISEKEFVRVAEALGDETFRLSFAIAQQPA